jgi:hypothetical protein
LCGARHEVRECMMKVPIEAKLTSSEREGGHERLFRKVLLTLMFIKIVRKIQTPWEMNFFM